jgi:Calcineurin-like phosphoesterase
MTTNSQSKPPLDPENIAGMNPSQIDALLSALEQQISPASALVHFEPSRATAVGLIGDSHGDWRSTQAAVEWFLESPNDRAFVGLGDYIDRAPLDCPVGSAVNALYLLSIKAAYPDRVLLVQGNHEAARRFAFEPHDFPGELAERWGNDRRRYLRFMELLERGPLAAYTSSGVFLAHGGFPSRLPSPWTDRFRKVDESLRVELLWTRVAAADPEPNIVPPFDGAALDDFLRASGLRVFLRGHDPRVVGRPLYHGHCLTLHTSRIYARFGGVLSGRFSLVQPVRSAADIEVERLPEAIDRSGAGRTRRTPVPPSEGRPLIGRLDTLPEDAH